MINQLLLYQFWDPNIYTYTYLQYRLLITKNFKKYIFICNDISYSTMKKTAYINKCKNCLVINYNPNEIEIYLHIDYIKYIIRQKLINNLLNE